MMSYPVWVNATLGLVPIRRGSGGGSMISYPVWTNGEDAEVISLIKNAY